MIAASFLSPNGKPPPSRTRHSSCSAPTPPTHTKPNHLRSTSRFDSVSPRQASPGSSNARMHAPLSRQMMEPPKRKRVTFPCHPNLADTRRFIDWTGGQKSHDVSEAPAFSTTLSSRPRRKEGVKKNVGERPFQAGRFGVKASADKRSKIRSKQNVQNDVFDFI